MFARHLSFKPAPGLPHCQHVHHDLCLQLRDFLGHFQWEAQPANRPGITWVELYALFELYGFRLETRLRDRKLKHKPARRAGTKVMYGREVKVAAKPASNVVRVLPAKALKDSV